MSSLDNVRLKAPLDVQFDITRKCQLDCSYCCAAPLDGMNVETGRAISLIEELGEKGVLSLLLSGGEAMLHPDFFSILAASRDHIPMISFGTNGIRLSNAATARKVKQTAPGALVTVSLDSLDVRTHDIHRGTGGEKAKLAIENGCEAGLQISVSCVVTPDNVDNADDIVDHYFPRVKKFAFFPRVSRSRAEKFTNFSSFSEQLDLLMQRLNRRASHNPQLDVMLPMRKIPGACGGTAFQEKSSCSCHRTKAYITSELNVFPCYYGAGKHSYLGNVQSRPFRDVWHGEKSETVYNLAENESLCGMRFLQDLVPSRFSETVYGNHEAVTCNT